MSRLTIGREITVVKGALRHGILVAASMVAGIGAQANAQAASLDAAVRREVIDTIAAQVERIYVDADTGRMIAATVRERQRAGAYDVSEPARLSQLLTADLRSVNHDLHLSVCLLYT